MKRLVFCALLIPFCSLACSKSDSKNSPDKESRAAVETKDSGEVAGSKLIKGSSSKKKGLRGEVISDINKDGGPAQSGKISLERGPGDEITGRIDLGGSVFLLRGIKESSNLRLWVSSDKKNPSEIKRGYLFGEVQGEKYVGNFAISGNGGKPQTQGKWKTDGVFEE